MTLLNFERMKFEIRDDSPTDQGVFNEMFVGDSYRVLNRRFSGIVYDVGCNIGLFACLAASRGAKKVVAFEPEPSNYELALANIERNGFGKIVELHNMGLSDHVGDDTLVSSHGNSYVGEIIAKDAPPNFGLVNIKLGLIDDFLKNDQLVEFLKMDIEGSETKVIPSSSLIGSNVKEFAMEHHGICQPWYDMIGSLVGYFDVTIESHAAPNHPYGGMMYGVSKCL